MKKKIFSISAVIILIAIIICGVYLFLNKQNSYNYSIDEQKWIEENKNTVIDLYMPSDINSLTESGTGLFFDFTNFFTKNTGIKINPIAYSISNETSGSNILLLTDKVLENDIEILSDEYVIIKKDQGLYNDIKDFANQKIGILENEKELLSSYLTSDMSITPFASKELLLASLENGTVDAIVGLKSIYLGDILNNKYHISYHISDLKKYYVLRIDDSDNHLNSIMKKEFSKFKESEYDKSYNSNLFNSYVKANNISEQEILNLNSKTYTYGYVKNGLFDNTKHRNLIGTNYYILKSFATFANVDMKYTDTYDNLSELNSALIDEKLDFYFDNTLFNTEVVEQNTVMPISSKIVFITKNDSRISVNSLHSLKNIDVTVLQNSKIQKYLEDNGISVKTYSSYKEMFKNKNLKNSKIIAIELENYEYYKTRSLRNYHISYISNDIVNYGFVVNKNNEMFKKLFDFYLEFINVDSVIKINYANVYEYEGLNIFLLIVTIVLSLIVIFQFIGKIKKLISKLLRKENNKMSKELKLKYIDNLTSLKNRAYLNDNIEKWDNSEIYPQIIIIVDLNNISYINDNFGHEEGDKVITEAANILIQTQLSNTEIIRTDGNEFLIYMVAYEEKKAISYIRKLSREFKNLSHGFGAAIGYSIINDAIKTIDDAVNEATLDMKTNKEMMEDEEK